MTHPPKDTGTKKAAGICVFNINASNAVDPIAVSVFEGASLHGHFLGVIGFDGSEFVSLFALVLDEQQELTGLAGWVTCPLLEERDSDP